MSFIYHQRCQRLRQNLDPALLRESQTGLEKETLRVNEQGTIAQTPHPDVLGSPLTHPYITTDYSEALLEFITPPLASQTEALTCLCKIQRFVCQSLDNEVLWANSMPCVVAGETSIPLAYYGTSNRGQMKTVYRRGLGYRYGRAMQIIAGGHYNFSFSDNFWERYRQLENSPQSLRDFKDFSYFGMIRNILRFGWIVPYLFGSSPAICKSFLNHQKTNLQEFNETTFYSPYACSLRMGDIGYQNNKENESGVKANYKSIDDYISSLRYAIDTPCERYKEIGVQVGGEYRQLNDHILQIENEYYSTVRPKQIVQGNEKPIIALRERGVQYIELRSLDISVYDPVGMNSKQLLFLETFMLYCLLKESPNIEFGESQAIDSNELLVAHEGRKPGLKLNRHGYMITLQDWASEILNEMQEVAAILDANHTQSIYQDAVAHQLQLVINPDMTPSARMLAEMREHDEGFYSFTRRMSLQHHAHFLEQPLTDAEREEFEQLAAASSREQREIEAADRISFTEFLDEYFSQI